MQNKLWPRIITIVLITSAFMFSKTQGGELQVIAAGQPPIELQAESETSFLVAGMDGDKNQVKERWK